jgi:hypothetical protein
MSLAQEEQAKLSPAKRAKVIPATTVAEAVDHLKLDLISAKQAKYNSLRSKLSKSIDLEHARQIADVYPDIVKSDIYVRLDYEYLSTNLLGALHAFNVEPNILLVRFQPCLRQPEKLRALISNISEQFQSKWNHIPPLEEDDISHDSRPDAYLMWPIRPGDHSPRSVEVHGLIVLIFCISIYYRIKVRKHVPS